MFAVLRPFARRTTYVAQSCYQSSLQHGLRSSHISPSSTARSFLSRTMASLTKWDRLIRYVSKDGSIKHGEPIVDAKADIDDLAQKGSLKVKVLEGSDFVSMAPTGQEDEVKELLGPLTPKDVAVIRCTGLNYKTHSKWTTSSPRCSRADLT